MFEQRGGMKGKIHDPRGEKEERRNLRRRQDWVEISWWPSWINGGYCPWNPDTIDPVSTENIFIITAPIVEGTTLHPPAIGRVDWTRPDSCPREIRETVIKGAILATLRPDLIGCYAKWASVDRGRHSDITPGIIVFNQIRRRMERFVFDYRGADRYNSGSDKPLEVSITTLRSLLEPNATKAEHHLHEHLELIGEISGAVPVAEQVTVGEGTEDDSSSSSNGSNGEMDRLAVSAPTADPPCTRCEKAVSHCTCCSSSDDDDEGGS